MALAPETPRRTGWAPSVALRTAQQVTDDYPLNGCLDRLLFRILMSCQQLYHRGPLPSQEPIADDYLGLGIGRVTQNPIRNAAVTSKIFDASVSRRPGGTG
jgi:hypothetical protein